MEGCPAFSRVCNPLDRLTEHKLAGIEQRIEELRRMRAALAELNHQCSGHGPVEGCPIIEALDDENPEADTDHE